ncbi:MAG: Cof-type HAD-IIB family hydrolase [Bacteroidales bacterium]|jgi:Cof subfamily protein (haloacid dehalogenase superfamily)|nr:Cof-type HAD-IIB family hydrolase [Bacteroidales bacterium]
MKRKETINPKGIKALFFDIDGTLVSFKSHTVPASAVTAIRQAQAKGIKAYIATGRAFFQIPELGGLQFDGYITQNGVYCITDKHEVVLKSPVPREDIEALLDHLDREPFSCSFMAKNRIVINFVGPEVEAVSQMVNVPVPPVGNLREAAEDEIFQVNIYVDREREQQLMRDVFVHCELSRWHPMFADINTKGFSKQTGIDKFLEYYNFRLDETMAFGDGGNDVSMLRHVAIGVAMGNASAEVQAQADYVTTSVDEDGISHALTHFGII